MPVTELDRNTQLHPAPSDGGDRKSTLTELPATTQLEQPSRGGAFWQGLSQAPGDVALGASQFESHLDPFQGLFPKHRDWVDQQVIKREQAYENDPQVQAHPGWARAGRTVGDVGTAAVVGAPVLAAGAPAGLLGAAGLGAATGALTALPQPVTRPSQYWPEKLTQVGMSTLEGGILGPVLHAAGSGLRWLINPAGWRAARTAATQQKASAQIGAAFEEVEKGGGPSAIDVMNQMMRARSTGQPYVLLDIPDARAVQRLGGSAYRGIGSEAAASHLEQFQKGRTGRLADSDALDAAMQHTQQGKRLNEWINTRIASGSARDEARALRLQRAANARPLWEKAMGHGPVWSERLQEFLDSPEGRKGLAEGWKLERQHALEEGRKIDATDYAITEFNEVGDPILGQVPNMRVLQMAKEGMDVQWEQLATYDAFGRLQSTKPLQRLAGVRRAFIAELDRLNPDYAAARAQWQGDTASREALEAGQRAFKPGAMTAEEFAEQWRNMTPGDREFFKVGVADTMRQNIARVGGTPDLGVTGDAAKTLMRNPEDRQKLMTMFPDQNEFNEFAGFIYRERGIFGTGVEIKGGSQTAERMAGDEAVRESIGAAHETARVALHGDPFAAVGLAGRVRRGMARLPGPQSRLKLETMRQLTDPDVPRRMLPTGQLQVGPPPPDRGIPWAPYVGGIIPYMWQSDPGYDAIAQGRQ